MKFKDTIIWFFERPYGALLAPILLFIGVGLVTEFFVREHRLRQASEHRLEALHSAGAVRAIIESEINATAYLANGVESYIAARHGDIKKAEMESMLGFLYGRGRHFRNIGVATGNKISYISPRAGNEPALGLYYPDNPAQWPVVAQTIRDNKPRLAGPVALVQGGEGLIYRVPVTIDGTYWGLISTVIDAHSLFSVMKRLDSYQSERFALRGRDGSGAKGEVFFGNPALFSRDAVTMDIQIPGGSWQVAVKQLADEGSFHAALARLLGWLLALLLAVLSYYLVRSINRQQSLMVAIEDQNHQLLETTELAEKASLAKSVFLANMSHEIRTPMNAILGFAQVMVRDPDLKVSQKENLAIIQRSGQHLLTLINDVLDMAKIEAGRMTLKRSSFDLPELVMETEAFFRQRAVDRGVRLTVETLALPRMVAGDEMRLRQVLINLVGNAVKFTTEGSVTLRVRANDGDSVLFSILDTGPGITPEELARLFEPFTQSESGRQIQGGTGLGLALSRQFVRLMGGELAAESEPGRGSCFSFMLRLPAVEADPADCRKDLSVFGLEPGQPACRILIVDDLPNNRQPLRALLESLNPESPVLEFQEAADGREAVAAWEAWQPHVIFMDMQMPVMSGEEATRRIMTLATERPDTVRTVVVALTANAFDENRECFLAAGCAEFASKPFQADELLAILERRAGLRFIRAAEALPTQPTLSSESVAAHLTVLPDQWRTDLKGAVTLGDFGRINTLLEQIREADPSLFEDLSLWAYNYDLDSFSSALAG